MPIQKRTTPGARYVALATKLLKVRGSAAGAGTLGALPSSVDIAALVDDLMAALFPGWGQSPTEGDNDDLRGPLAETLRSLEARVENAVFHGWRRRCGKDETPQGCRAEAQRITQRFLNALPEIRALLLQDVEASFEADPAATGFDEIVACYPGFYAIAVYRAAHRLLREGAQIIPRMMTEHAHARTGIDIHPGAQVGPSFFIDHGTGTVIGETTVIGSSVRIYQGVTLGALSVKRRGPSPAAPTTKPGKRHPTIEDNVIIYANATILGGDTIIGRGAVIGGNAWITYSVPPGVRVGVGT